MKIVMMMQRNALLCAIPPFPAAPNDERPSSSFRLPQHNRKTMTLISSFIGSTNCSYRHPPHRSIMIKPHVSNTKNNTKLIIWICKICLLHNNNSMITRTTMMRHIAPTATRTSQTTRLFPTRPIPMRQIMLSTIPFIIFLCKTALSHPNKPATSGNWPWLWPKIAAIQIYPIIYTNSSIDTTMPSDSLRAIPRKRCNSYKIKRTNHGPIYKISCTSWKIGTAVSRRPWRILVTFL